ncbi:hypothetical protein [Candidatus Viadribacter manganicus]|uniref:Uncharacterized protein n=1 Tax=Candidatus Viadribacter manganicus TaxID=1759059 RepID=A0A1B1AE22_9PROT|nr:hypothetical protein [Candidatus Viadribacter manganicus]ANP44806.1 hypothetical protein ATE48_02130 [Candidatus Viadribacter manganicus]
MTDFDALLKRSFAEAHEPADDGFVVNVTNTVAHREASLKARGYMQYGAITIAAAAVSWGLYTFAGVFGQEMMATAGLEVARMHAAVNAAPDASAAAQGFLQSMGAGLTQILLVTAALAGGAVAYRSTQD